MTRPAASISAASIAAGARPAVAIVDVRDLAAARPWGRKRDLEDLLTGAFGVRPAFDWDGTQASTHALSALIVDAVARARPREKASSVTHDATGPRFVGAPWHALVLDEALVPSLASRCCVRGGRPLVFGTHVGHALDVTTNTDVSVPELALAHAINGDGTRILRHARTEGSRETSIELVDADSSAVIARAATSGLPFSFADGWAGCGWRCTFTWLRATHDTLDVVAGCAHDWPVGHAKKQFGYRDNEPSSLSVAPDGAAYVSRFERDALVAASVPLAWRRVGPVALLEWPPEDTLRRLFFVPGWDMVHAPAGTAAAALEEDAREAAPALVVGPDDHARYALGLDAETWAVVADGRAERVGGPNDGFLVCDVTHAPVRRGSGRLLCGTARTLYVHDDDGLFREDFVTGAREELGREHEPIHTAFAFPGADNALLVGPPTEREDGATTVRVRLI